MYGWRGRIGLLVPATNTTMETELWSLAPEGVSVHTARIPTQRHATLDTLRRMEDDSKDAAARVAQCEVDVVLYACTSGSFIEGAEYNQRICDQLTEITGVPTVTTAGAMADSLVASGFKTVDVVSPYIEITNERLVAFLNHFGIKVNRLGAFDMIDQFDHAKVESEAIYQKVKQTASEEAEAVFIACTQLRALEVVQMLEADLKKPVYSAVQATAWRAFEILGVDPGIEDHGSLLRKLRGGF